MNLASKKQATFWSKHRDTDADKISLEVLSSAVDELVNKKLSEQGGTEMPAKNDAPVAHDHATAPAHAASTAAHTHSAAETAIAVQIEEAIASLGLSDEEAVREMQSADPNSALAMEIARKTGKKPEVVAQELAALAAEHASEPKELGWVCMFCGNSNPGCPYKGRPDRAKFNALAR